MPVGYEAQDATDEQLVERVQRGEVDAFSILFERHYGRIGRFLRQIGIPAPEVEDLLAETFCRALEKIHLYRCRGENRYLSYLYAIARNLAIDRRRRPMPVVSLEEMPEGWEASDGKGEDAMVEEIYRLEQIALIRQAMERLSSSDREILALAYDRELTCREIMEITGKPSVSAVTTHVYKAIQKLRQQVLALAPASGGVNDR